MVKRHKKTNYCKCGSGIKYKECCIFKAKRTTNLSTAENLDKLKHFGSTLRDQEKALENER